MSKRIPIYHITKNLFFQEYYTSFVDKYYEIFIIIGKNFLYKILLWIIYKQDICRKTGKVNINCIILGIYK